MVLRSIYLDEETDLRLAVEAEKRGVDKSELIKRYIDQGLMIASQPESLFDEMMESLSKVPDAVTGDVEITQEMVDKLLESD